MNSKTCKRIRKTLRDNGQEITSVKGRQLYKKVKRYYKGLR